MKKLSQLLIVTTSLVVLSSQVDIKAAAREQ
jgi:hypothetical protein